MEQKHTPGPWAVNGNTVSDADGFGICDSEDLLVLQSWETKGVNHWGDKPGETYREISFEEAEANAKLIAAAPELLEALTAIVSCYGVGYKSADQFVKDVEIFMSEAQSVIKKATA